MSVLFAEIEDVELIFEKSLVAGGGSPVDDELVIGDGDSSMGGPFGWHEIVFEVEFEPSRGRKIVYEGFVGYDKLVWVRGELLARDTAPPKSTARVLETIVKLCPNLGLGMSPTALIFSSLRLFI